MYYYSRTLRTTFFWAAYMMVLAILFVTFFPFFLDTLKGALAEEPSSTKYTSEDESPSLTDFIFGPFFSDSDEESVHEPKTEQAPSISEATAPEPEPANPLAGYITLGVIGGILVIGGTTVSVVMVRRRRNAMLDDAQIDSISRAALQKAYRDTGSTLIQLDDSWPHDVLALSNLRKKVPLVSETVDYDEQIGQLEATLAEAHERYGKLSYDWPLRKWWLKSFKRRLEAAIAYGAALDASLAVKDGIALLLVTAKEDSERETPEGRVRRFRVVRSRLMKIVNAIESGNLPAGVLKDISAHQVRSGLENLAGIIERDVMGKRVSANIMRLERLATTAEASKTAPKNLKDRPSFKAAAVDAMRKKEPLTRYATGNR